MFEAEPVGLSKHNKIHLILIVIHNSEIIRYDRFFPSRPPIFLPFLDYRARSKDLSSRVFFLDYRGTIPGKQGGHPCPQMLPASGPRVIAADTHPHREPNPSGYYPKLKVCLINNHNDRSVQASKPKN